MRFRLFAAGCLLVVVVTLLSFLVLLRFDAETASGRTVLALASGTLEYDSSIPRASNSFAVDERYQVSVSPNVIDSRGVIWKLVRLPWPNYQLQLPLMWLAIAGIVFPVTIYFLTW